jgi:hypothetical protein
MTGATLKLLGEITNSRGLTPEENEAADSLLKRPLERLPFTLISQLCVPADRRKK